MTVQAATRRQVVDHYRSAVGRPAVIASRARRKSDILRAVDKIQKKRKQEIIQEYQGKGYSVSDLEKVLEFSQIKGTPKEIEKKIDVSRLQNWNKILQLFESLKNRGVENIRINFGIVRGLDYYSGIVFEVFDSSSDLGALVGGGRYDTLTKALAEMISVLRERQGE